jgi:protein-L-isoaspartate(D-aspartate) O-methyltransferase
MIHSNEELIEELVDLGYLKSERLIEAFRAINRKDFVPPDVLGVAYINEPLPIGYGQTISQPLTVAFMLELLDLRGGDKVLEIGSGSGWQTALIAHMIELAGGAAQDPDGRYGMVAMEIIPQLASMTKKNITPHGFIERGIVRVVLGDGSLGYEGEAPYDKIIAAAAADGIPESWKEQLKIGGRIVAPVRHSIVVLDKKDKKEFEQKEFFGFAFVPLVKEK